MSTADTSDAPEVPRVDELFNRALVAQLAEQRAQRETFAEVERKLEGLERLVTDRLGDLTRQLGADGQLEARIELLEETLGTRLTAIEKVVRGELDNRLGPLADRLGQLEQSLVSDETGAKLMALEATVRRRLTNLEEAVRSDDVPDRLGRLERALAEALNGGEAGPILHDPALGLRFDVLERSVADRLAGVEDSLRSHDVARRLAALEASVGDRLSDLEDTVRSEEVGRRLKSLELALDERSGRIEEFVKTADLEHRIEALGQAVDERLAEFGISLAGVAAEAGVAGVTGEGGLVVERVITKVDDSVGERLAGLEGSLVRLQEDTAARLEALREASVASEAGILERIIAESQVVGAHFQAVRPVVEAAVAAGPEIEQALVEVRRLADAAREAAAELVSGVAGPPAPTEPDSSGPYRVESLEEAAATAVADGDAIEKAESVFQPPEETPIPERRFGILPRRDR
jgi:hypothetical protein